jgi:Zn-dependent M28 family amino/carboxypeptidase
MRIPLLAVLAAAVAASAHAAPASRLHEIKDPDTRAWWAITETLAGDDMEGRDVASAAYDRAAHLVARRFEQAGLKPAGDNGSWFQEVPLHEVQVLAQGTSFTVERDQGGTAAIAFLHDISIRAADDLPARLTAPLTFRGYCAPADLAQAAGKVVICFNTKRQGLTTSAQRIAAAQAAGAAAIVQVDDPGFTIEPYRWPAAYARSVTFADDKAAPSIPAMTLSPAGFQAMIEGSGQSAEAILKAGGDKQPLPAFDIPARLSLTLAIAQRDYVSRNVLAVLPGADPQLAAQHLVVSAHLDGYGHGEPVAGDGLYNGALDDAAYVALLVRLAERQEGKAWRRSVVFAAFTGEEKGLLGARWFVRHPTVPRESLVGDINLDQLRPLFPLKILTTHALTDTSLGDTARQVGAGLGVTLRPDLEPERGLLMRADHWPFLQAGVPAIGFVFGFDPGTEAEARYRQWYQVRYHRPQDDLTQPMDWTAANTFNRFFYALTQAVADAEAKPSWSPASPLKPKPKP